MASNDRFLGGVAPLTTPRTISEAKGLRAIVSQNNRSTLTQAERIKLQTSAEKGLESKYDLLDNVNLTDVETLKAVYQMAIRTEELKEDMARYDIQEVFLIPNEMEWHTSDFEYHPASGAQAIDLFLSAADTDLELVKQASE